MLTYQSNGSAFPPVLNQFQDSKFFGSEFLAIFHRHFDCLVFAAIANNDDLVREVLIVFDSLLEKLHALV